MYCTRISQKNRLIFSTLFPPISSKFFPIILTKTTKYLRYQKLPFRISYVETPPVALRGANSLGGDAALRWRRFGALPNDGGEVLARGLLCPSGTDFFCRQGEFRISLSECIQTFHPQG